MSDATPDDATPPPSVPPIGKARLETLADGVFAIVMTLLGLELIPREPVPVTAAAVRAWLVALWPKVLSYVLSFVVVAIFWVAHHSEFHFIRHTDRRHLWINLALLLTLTFVPFSAALLGQHPDLTAGPLVYGANLLASAMLLIANWTYATRGRRLVDPALPEAVVRWFFRRLAVGPVLYAFGAALAFVSPRASVAVYVFAVVYYVAVQNVAGAPPGSRSL